MGFGGSGSNTTLNHVHNGLVGEGGSLDNTTLLNGSLLIDTAFSPITTGDHTWTGINQFTNSSELASGKRVLLDSYEASGAQSTYTFTPTTSLDMVNTYSEIVVVGSLTCTAALGLDLTISGGTSHNYEVFSQIGTSLAGSESTSQASIPLATTALGTAANRDLIFEIHIQGWDKGGQQLAAYQTKCSSGNNGVEMVNGGINTLNTMPITEIKIVTTASTWKDAGMITVYGVGK